MTANGALRMKIQKIDLLLDFVYRRPVVIPFENRQVLTAAGGEG